MNETLGQVSYTEDRPTFLGQTDMYTQSVRNYSEETAAQIDTAVRNLTAAAFEKATRVLKTHHQALDETAALLLAKETLSADELPALEPYVDAPELLSPTGSSRSDSPVRG